VELLEKGGVPRTTMNDTHFKSIMSDFETKNKTSVMTLSISPLFLLTLLKSGQASLTSRTHKHILGLKNNPIAPSTDFKTLKMKAAMCTTD